MPSNNRGQLCQKRNRLRVGLGQLVSHLRVQKMTIVAIGAPLECWAVADLAAMSAAVQRAPAEPALELRAQRSVHDGLGSLEGAPLQD